MPKIREDYFKNVAELLQKILEELDGESYEADRWGVVSFDDDIRSNRVQMDGRYARDRTITFYLKGQ